MTSAVSDVVGAEVLRGNNEVLEMIEAFATSDDPTKVNVADILDVVRRMIGVNDMMMAAIVDHHFKEKELVARFVGN